MDESDLLMVTRRFAASAARLASEVGKTASPAAVAADEMARAAAATGMFCAEYAGFSRGISPEEGRSLADAEREVVRTRYWLDLIGELEALNGDSLRKILAEADGVRDLIRAIRKKRCA